MADKNYTGTVMQKEIEGKNGKWLKTTVMQHRDELQFLLDHCNEKGFAFSVMKKRKTPDGNKTGYLEHDDYQPKADVSPQGPVSTDAENGTQLPF